MTLELDYFTEPMMVLGSEFLPIVLLDGLIVEASPTTRPYSAYFCGKGFALNLGCYSTVALDGLSMEVGG